MSRSSIVGRGERFSLLRNVKTESGAHPASYTMGIGGCFSPGVKRPVHEADRPPLSSAEVNVCGAKPPLTILLHGIVLN
jgi:hypothetical protein